MLKRALENLVKAWMTTLPTMLILAIVLTLFHLLLSVHSRAQTSIDSLQKKLTIVVYIKDDADPFEVTRFQEAIAARSDVVPPVVYTSREDAQRLLSKTISLDTQLLERYNFSLPASLTITPQSPASVEELQAFIAELGKNIVRTTPGGTQEGRSKLTSSMVDFLSTLDVRITRTLFIFIVLFTIGGILLMASALHLSITKRHREIGIMTLIGAGQNTIVKPFILEGMAMGIGAFLIHLFFILLMPFVTVSSTFHLNALLFELMGILALTSLTSYVVARLHIRLPHLFVL